MSKPIQSETVGENDAGDKVYALSLTTDDLREFGQPYVDVLHQQLEDSDHPEFQMPVSLSAILYIAGVASQRSGMVMPRDELKKLDHAFGIAAMFAVGYRSAEKDSDNPVDHAEANAAKEASFKQLISDYTAGDALPNIGEAFEDFRKSVEADGHDEFVTHPLFALLYYAGALSTLAALAHAIDMDDPVVRRWQKDTNGFGKAFFEESRRRKAAREAGG